MQNELRDILLRMMDEGASQEERALFISEYKKKSQKNVVTTTTASPLGQGNTSITSDTEVQGQGQPLDFSNIISNQKNYPDFPVDKIPKDQGINLNIKPQSSIPGGPVIKNVGSSSSVKGGRPTPQDINPRSGKPYASNLHYKGYMDMFSRQHLEEDQKKWDIENSKATLGRELTTDQQKNVDEAIEKNKEEEELRQEKRLQAQIKRAQDLREKEEEEKEKEALSKIRPTEESINIATGKVYGDDKAGNDALLRDQKLFDERQEIEKIQESKYDYLTPEFFSQYEGSVAEFLNKREDLNKDFFFEETGYNLLGNSDFVKISTLDEDGNKNGLREYIFEVDIPLATDFSLIPALYRGVPEIDETLKSIEKLKVFLDRNKRESLKKRDEAQRDIYNLTSKTVPSQKSKILENIEGRNSMFKVSQADALEIVLPPMTIPEWQLTSSERFKLDAARKVILSETEKEQAILKEEANIKELYEKRGNNIITNEEFQKQKTEAENILMAVSGSNDKVLTNAINQSISATANNNAIQLKNIEERNEQLAKDQESILLKIENGEDVSRDDIAKIQFDAVVLERDIENLTMSDSELSVLMKDIEDNAALISMINEREGSTSGIITNNFIKGASTFLRMLGADREFVDEIVENATDPSTKKEYEESEDRTFGDKLLATVSNMFGVSVPSFLAGPYSGYVSAVGFMAQAKYQILDEMNDNPDFANMSDTKKGLISNIYGTVVGLLERYGFSKMISKSPLSKKATLFILRDVLKNLPKKVTTETLEKAIQATTKRMVANGGIQSIAAGGQEASTEFTQGVFEIGLKEVVNLAEGKDLFKQDLSGQAVFDNLAEQTLLGFAAGAGINTAAQAVNITKQGFKNSGLDKEVSKLVLSLNRSKEFRSTMSNYFKTKILQGEVTKEEALISLQAYDVMMGRASKIPSDIEDVTGAFDLITERVNIENEIEGKDPALIVKKKERIKEINSELSALIEKAPATEEVTETKEAPVADTQTSEVETKKDTEKKPGEKDNIAGVDILYPTDKEAEERKEERTKPEYVDEAAKKNEQEDVEQLKSELDGEFGILTGENPLGQPLTEQENSQLNEKAEAWLKEKGYKPRKVTGKYGQAENSFVVPNLTKEDAIAFAKEFNQESVAHSEGLVYQDGSMNPRVKTEDNFEMNEYTPESDFVSVVNTPEGLKTFSVGYDFDTKTEPTPTVEVEPTVEAEPLTEKELKVKRSGVVTQVEKAKKALRKIAPNVEFVLHDSDASFKKATGGIDAGAYTRKKGVAKIHVNVARSNNRTVGHEVFHALIYNQGLNLKQVQNVTSRMLKSISKEASPELLKRLDKFSKTYPENQQSEESIAELFGIISESYSALSSKSKSVIKRWLNKLIKLLNLEGIIGKDLSILKASDSEVVEFLDSVAKKVATGQEIAEGDVGVLSKVKGKDVSAKKRRQAEDLFLSDKKKKFDSLKDVAKFLDSWSKENKLFEDDLKNISDEKIVDEFVKHIELELKAWEKVRKDNYVSFYDNDIIEKTNPTLQDYAKKEYGRPLTDTEVKLYHIVSAFASPSANPEMDSWKGFDIFDRFMKTGELSGYSDKIATVWDWTTTKKGNKVKKDTGVPRLDKDGNTIRSLMTMAYSQSGLDKFNILIDKMGGDLNKAMDWITSTHSYAEISKMFEFPEKGPKALKQNEYMSKEDGGLGVFGMTGAKLGSYILNRFGNFSTVTKDMWYARTMARLAGQDLVTENKKTQKKGAIKTPWAESTKEGRRMRTLADKAFKELAKRFKTSPAMIQERIWDFEKRMYEKLGANEDAAYTSDGLKKGIERASQKDITRQQKTGSAYFSNALEAVGNIKDTNPKQPVQWVKALTDPQKNGGVGGVNQELKWIGLEDYLTEWQKENKVKSIPQNIVKDYINDNQIEIVDVTMSGERATLGLTTNEMLGIEEDVIRVEVVEDDNGYYILQDQEGNRLRPNDRWSSKTEAESDAVFLFPDYYHSSIASIPSRPLAQRTPRAKYEDWSLPGGENYQEVLLTLPSKIERINTEIDALTKKRKFIRDKYGILASRGNIKLTADRKKEVDKITKELVELYNKREVEGNIQKKRTGKAIGKAYKSSHFDQENILAHVRMDERTLSNGEKVMFIQEVQSDWAQEGRKRGFASPEDKVKIEEAEKKKQEVLNSSKSYELLNKKTEGDLSLDFFNAIQQKATDSIDNPYFDPESRKERFLEEYQGRLSYWGRWKAVPKMSKEEWANFYDFYLNELSNNKKKVTGYGSTYRLADIDEKIKALDAEIFSYREKDGVPDMPYKKTDQWVSLAIRRVMKMAADKGFDRIAWVTGEQSADRYNLSKSISNIQWDTSDNVLSAQNKEGALVFQEGYITEDKLEDYVGKETAKKLIDKRKSLTEEDEGVVEIKDQDLEVGGEAMKTFYNSIVPKNALAEAKRFDKKAKIDVIGLPIVIFKDAEVDPPTTKQLSIAITPEMNQKLEGGIGVTRMQKVNWEVSPEGKGDPSISSRDDVVSRAAKKLKEGKISNKKWREIINKRSPITPITRFFEPATLDRMKSAMKENQKQLINANIKAGAKVGLRLDIPAYKNKNTWVVSVHDNENNLGVAGKAISYRNVAKIKNVRFDSSEISTPRAALNIASGDKNKATIARIYGEWVNFDGKNSEEQAENAKKEVQGIVNSKEWVQIGMNPFRHSYFYDRSTVDKDGKIIGDPVKTADELLQIGGLVYAKNPTYGKWTDKEYTVQVRNKVTKEMQPLLDSEGDVIRFQKKGKKETPVEEETLSIKEIIDANPDAIASDVNKALIEHGYSAEEVQKYREKQEGVYNFKTGSIKVDAIIKSINTFRKKMLSARRLLPKSWYKFMEQKEANIAYHLKLAGRLSRGFNKAVRKYKGDKQELLKDFDAYLRGNRWKRVNKKGETKYFKNEVKGGAEINLPKKTKSIANSMRNHIDALSQSLIDSGIVEGLSAENVKSNIGEYVTTSYKMYTINNWRSQVDKEVMQSARNFIEQNSKSLIEDRAKREGITYEEAAKQFLDLEIDSILKKGEESRFLARRGLSKDMSVLKRKQDIPPEIQNLMGIYHEPGLAYLNTIIKNSALAAQHQYLKNLKKTGLGVFIFEEKDRKMPFNTRISSENNPAMEPLNKLYTSKELLDELKRADKELTGFLKFYMRLVGAVKYSKTILSPATHGKNIFGNLGFMFVNGHYNAQDWAKTFNILVRDATSLSETEYTKKMDEYIKSGVAGQSAGLGEMKAMLRDVTSKNSIEDAMIDRLTRKSLTLRQAVKKRARRFFKGAEDLYQAEDDFFKIIAYESEKARHLKVVAYDKGKKVSELTDKEIEKAKEMAAEKVKSTLPTYSRVPTLFQWARKSPLVGSFVAFHAESFRTAGNTAALAYKEIVQPGVPLKSRNPHLTATGAKRIVGTGVYVSAKTAIFSAMSWGAGAGIGLLGGLFDDDDETQMQKDIAYFLPIWSKDSDIVVTEMKPGKFTYMDVSSSDPHGAHAKMLNAYIRNGGGMDGVIHMAKEFLLPIVSGEILTEAIVQLKNNTDAYGNRIYDKTDTIIQRIPDISNFMIKIFEPGGSTSARRIANAKDMYSEIVGAFTGYRLIEVDVTKAAGFKIREIADLMREAKKTYNRTFNQYEKYIIAKNEGEEVDKKDIRTEEDVVREYKAANVKIRGYKQDLIDLWNRLDRLGMTTKNKLQEEQFLLFKNNLNSTELTNSTGDGIVYDMKTKESDEGIDDDLDYGKIKIGEPIEN
jgi:hypothetical protein